MAKYIKESLKEGSIIIFGFAAIKIVGYALGYLLKKRDVKIC